MFIWYCWAMVYTPIAWIIAVLLTVVLSPVYLLELFMEFEFGYSPEQYIYGI